MKTSKKIPKTFITFLIISSLIWLLITFSKEYKSVLTFAVNYTNIAQDKLLQETPIKEIDIAVKATGFKILRSKIRNKIIDLDASVLKRKKNSKFYFLPQNQTLKIQKQLISGVELQKIIQDTIYLNLGVLTSKKVALQPELDIKYHIGYDLLGEISYQPDSIVISGPKSQLKNINHLKLSKLVLNDVKADFSKEVKILNPEKQKKLKYKVLKATISGKVDKFTEGKLQVPFDIINLPANTNLTTLTENIEVVFVVALSNFTKVSKASFKIECDYSISEKNNLGYLIPKVITKPDFLKNIKITPTKIDFLIQK
ncbi:YbbR-like domain-containing protein [Polaribacter vadi]|uniref:CdaR family protein n=1 Tax=Polaribacter TaxID=52959 RepID=UPI001C096140|nr:YbbR-like domain-containing protein [Polaribacter sp. 1_MG-2023]MBU3013005.1 YbbR-like domain-containing protein [Polaribacter vadi]MDO6742823.1 YbbR-like domain-containing protein [Polaribacter sp. 1_MG-2023]